MVHVAMPYIGSKLICVIDIIMLSMHLAIQLHNSYLLVYPKIPVRTIISIIYMNDLHAAMPCFEVILFTGDTALSSHLAIYYQNLTNQHETSDGTNNKLSLYVFYSYKFLYILLNKSVPYYTDITIVSTFQVGCGLILDIFLFIGLESIWHFALLMEELIYLS